MNDSKLHTIFNHSECLSEDQLLGYVQNNLTEHERNAVEQHSINCKFCSDAIEGFEEIKSFETYNHLKTAFVKKDNSLYKYFIGIAASLIIVLLLTMNKNISKDQLKVENDKEVTNVVDSNTIFEKANKNKPILTFKDTSIVLEVKPKQIKKPLQPNKKSPKKEEFETSKNNSFAEVRDSEIIIEENLEEKDFNADAILNKETKSEVPLENEAILDNAIVEAKRDISYKSNNEPEMVVERKLKEATLKQKNGKSIDPSFQKGKSLFNIKKYKDAISTLIQIPKEDKNYMEANLLIAKSYILIKQKDEAIKFLNIVTSSENSFKKEALTELNKLK